MIVRWSRPWRLNVCRRWTTKANRFSSVQKKRISVDQPKVVRLYNDGMGGVDRLDQNLSCYMTNFDPKSGIGPSFDSVLIWPYKIPINFTGCRRKSRDPQSMIYFHFIEKSCKCLWKPSQPFKLQLYHSLISCSSRSASSQWSSHWCYSSLDCPSHTETVCCSWLQRNFSVCLW